MKIMAVPTELHHSSNHNGLAESGDANCSNVFKGFLLLTSPPILYFASILERQLQL